MSNATTVKPVLKEKTKAKVKSVVGVDGRAPNLAKIFFDHGIKAHVFPSTTPDANDMKAGLSEPLFMTLNRDRNKLDFDPGTAKVTLYFDKKYRQVVVVLEEKARDIERTFATGVWAPRHDSERKIRERARARIAAGEGFPVRIPGEVTYEVKSIKYLNLKEFKQSTPGALAPSRLQVETTVVAHCKPLKAAFLVGWDEGAMFISCLPKVVKSVEAAHEALRPKGVPKGTLRIGEFFFVQASDQMQKTLTKRYVENTVGLEGIQPIHDSDNHYAAMLVTYNQNEYVRGLVWDDEDRHAEVWFDQWHRVYRNTEIDPPRGVEADSVD